MDFATRDRYRHVIERLARASALPEVEVAQRVVVEAFEAAKGSPQGQIGYYLIDDGREALETFLGIKRRLIGAAAQNLAPKRLGTLRTAGRDLAGRTCGSGNLCRLARRAAGLRSSCWPSRHVSRRAKWPLRLQIISPRFGSRRALPKMDFKDGIPSSAQSIVVVPTLLLSTASLRGLLQRLESHYLSNPDAATFFRPPDRFRRRAAASDAGRCRAVGRRGRGHSRIERALYRGRQNPLLALSTLAAVESAWKKVDGLGTQTRQAFGVQSPAARRD